MLAVDGALQARLPSVVDGVGRGASLQQRQDTVHLSARARYVQSRLT